MTQQPATPPPPPLTELKLTNEIKDAINNAYIPNNKPLIVAYVDESGQPSLSIRGSAITYGDTALAVWARNPEGGILKALGKNPHVTLFFRDPDTRIQLQFKGTARVDASESARNMVYTTMPERERTADPEKKGSAVIIDLERVDGMVPPQRVAMRK